MELENNIPGGNNVTPPEMKDMDPEDPITGVYAAFKILQINLGPVKTMKIARAIGNAVLGAAEQGKGLHVVGGRDYLYIGLMSIQDAASGAPKEPTDGSGA
jgi:hypothetical protein